MWNSMHPTMIQTYLATINGNHSQNEMGARKSGNRLCIPSTVVLLLVGLLIDIVLIYLSPII